MILRFLRLFAPFCALEAELESARISAERWEHAAKESLSASERQLDSQLKVMAERDRAWKDAAETGNKLSEANTELADVRAALQEENTQRLILQDRLDAAQESVSRLWGMVDSAQQRAYRAMEMQVNFATQQKFGVTPYPEASHLPPSAEADLDFDKIVNRRMLPSELVAQQRQRLEAEMIERLAKKSA